MASGAPDYERIVTVVAETQMGVGAPDWTRIVVGAGGVPIGGTSNNDLISSDRDFVGWTFDPYLVDRDGVSAASGQIAFALVKATKTTSILDIWAWFQNAGTGLTSDENYLGVYSFTGSSVFPTTMTLLGATAAGLMDTVPGAGQPAAYALASSVAVTAGDLYYVAALFNATSRPQFNYLSDPSYTSSIPVNPTMLSAASTYTTLPSSLVGANVTYSGIYFWSAIV